MSQILLAWELGGGWSHIGAMRPLVGRLSKADHRVTAASRDFVPAAVRIARDIKRLRFWKHNLRTQMQQSSLLDGRRLAQRIEEAYRQATTDFRSYARQP